MKKVLAIMCSRHRPMMFRHTVLQLLRQTHPVDLVVYINSNEKDDPENLTAYQNLISDCGGEINIRVRFGDSVAHHNNYMRALELANVEDYDIFLKIDDDDYYGKNYVEDIVASHDEHNWDLSGEHSVGVINGKYWRPHQTIKNMGLEATEVCCGMAATWALSRRAMQSIMQLEARHDWFEDRLWKHHIETETDLKRFCRGDKPQNYHYVLHGENSSTADWLIDREPELRTPSLTSFQAVRVALNLLRQALPLLPQDLYLKIKRKR